MNRDANRSAEKSRGIVGRVLSVRSSQATIGLADPSWTGPGESRATVGRFLGIRCAGRLAVGVVTECAIGSPQIACEQTFTATATVDLVGEIKDPGKPTARFRRGVASYPAIGDEACQIMPADFQAIYGVTGPGSIEIGTLQQAECFPATVNVDEMLSKHFAVLGTTGVGKSSGVATILREIIGLRPDLRIFLVDPHNEYGRCFGERAQVLTPTNMRLPFWLFNFEEIADVIFRRRPDVAEETEILAEVIPIARSAYAAGGRPGADRGLRRGNSRAAYTADTPVPYRISDVVALIEDRMGRLEAPRSHAAYSRLLSYIDSVASDPRNAFMFDSANVGGDTMSSVLSYLFRLPTEDRPMTVMQLAGFPTEVVDSVVSVLGRMAFDFGLWSDGKLPLLFVCEEAHRYASADRNLGFGPTRRAIARIAKEGRKYGVFLGLVTQRPAELDPTIISQCSTFFAMRMSNERDQALVRSAVSDAAANFLGFLPSLGTREAFAFGEGVSIPTRLMFKELAADDMPRSEAVANTTADLSRRVDLDFIDLVVERWRRATLNSRVRQQARSEMASSRGNVFAAGPDAPAEARRSTDLERTRPLKNAASRVS